MEATFITERFICTFFQNNKFEFYKKGKRNKETSFKITLPHKNVFKHGWIRAYVYDFVFEIQFLKKDHKKKETPIIVKNPFTKKYI